MPDQDAPDDAPGALARGAAEVAAPDPEAGRRAQREAWLARCLAARGERPLGPPVPLLADASFRRFERIATDAGPRIVMDAPPERENNVGFLTVAHWLETRRIPAARVLAVDEGLGLLLVSDLGDQTLARDLDRHPEKARTRYAEAVDALVAFQIAGSAQAPPFPAYGAERLALENAIFAEWFVQGLLDLAPPALLEDTLAVLTERHLAAPRVPVHLDWHSRNLMITGDGIALVDFQDARIGPQGYDLVSLLRDCYRSLPEHEVAALVDRFVEAGRARRLPGCEDRDDFLRTFDLLGIQRHLKAIGIFARLSLRDGRHHALPDIDRTLAYLVDVAPRHDETRALGAWLERDVVPRRAAWRQGDTT